jgi:hypothetical protein
VNQILAATFFERAKDFVRVTVAQESSAVNGFLITTIARLCYEGQGMGYS